MRTASRTVRASRFSTPSPGAGLAILVAGLVAISACGPDSASTASVSTNASGAPPVQPTANIHIDGSVDANRIFQLLAAARLPVHQETLQGPGPKGEPNATLFIVDGSIKVSIDQFSSPRAVATAGYTAGSRPVRGDAPYTLWAANIVIHIGNRQSGALPAGPDGATVAAAGEIARAIDPYIGPLTQRSVVALQLPSTPQPSVEAPTPTPAATASPKPTPKPTAKPKPKPSPTKKPKH
jgi:hypothetical protein